MKYRPLGDSRIQASVVGFGAWAIGGWSWGGTNESDAIAAIHAAIDNGVNLIDTAPAYGFGLSEELVGKAIADRRDKVVLASKCGLVWDTADGQFHTYADEKSYSSEPSKIELRKLLRADSIVTQIEASLKRLKTDYIDLFQTHRPDNTTTIEETAKTLFKLRQDGKIRAIGVSNVSVDQLKEYSKYCTVSTDQERFSILDRKIENDLIPHCRANKIAMLAYSPLAKGLLTGKIGPNRKFNPGDQRLTNTMFSEENRKKVANLLKKFKPIADGHNIELSQLAIAWAISQPGLTHALCGARNPQQAIENAKAAQIELTEEELEFISAQHI